MTESASERRTRLTHRALPALAGLAAAALGAGIVAGALSESELERTAERFARAWERRDYPEMHGLLTPESRGGLDTAGFARAYEDARATATERALDVTGVEEAGGEARLSVSVRTRAFGAVREEVRLTVTDGRVVWDPQLVFPGLRRGERLTRTSRPPRRAGILARDGRTIVEGPAGARSFPLGEVGRSIAGAVGPAQTEADRDDLHARGFPRDAPTGLSGLERILERRVAGTPGGELIAGRRTLASSEPRPGRPVRTTIDVEVQRAAVAALGGRFGGVAALDARTARVRALAGIAFSGPQPPGSTFKLVTTTAALEAKLVEPSTPFPVATEAVIEGVELENAHGEACGGTFTASFAHSCNSVFAPLGVRIGARRLVETAERYGFNEDPGIRGAAASTLPGADEIRSPLELGATAIGQGRVLATPLQLASIAQTIAADGLRRRPTVLARARRRRPVRVTSRRVARTLERLMIAVVEYGTGTSASLAPVKVAGKTGTAELEDTTKEEGEEGGEERPEETETDTDAWFAAYAPARRPRLAVAVLLVRAGAGGETAAPVARLVLQAGLR